MRNAGIVFDLPLSRTDKPQDAQAEAVDRNSRIRSAVEKAEHYSENHIVSQDIVHELEKAIPVEDRYAFRMALVEADLKVRTGAVNIVDREEPIVRGLGDASTNGVDLWTSSPALPRDELNTDPGGSVELEYGKPRRSEGSLDEPTEKDAGGFGNNLTDLTMTAALSVADVSPNDIFSATVKVAQGYGEGSFATSTEKVVAMLNHALGLEYSQALRYRIYADTLRIAFREALAEEFEAHADEETEHAQALSAKIVALGGTLSPKIVEPVLIAPSDPNLVDRVLRELWKHEQDGIKFYRALKKALGENIFVHYIEEVLVAESEHADDLVRFTQVVKSAAVVPLPSYPARSEAARWNESYSDENQFEGLDKMGDAEAELGRCPHCQKAEVLGVSCEACCGKTATAARALCSKCAGVGFVKECVLCGSSWSDTSFSLPAREAARVTAWQVRADRVKKKTVWGEFPIWLEYLAGDTRRGQSLDGTSWERVMHADYGFIPGTRVADGEPIDVYLGKAPSRRVYVVSQLRPGGGFDEEKVMLGFPNAQQAEATYRSHLPNNGARFFGGIREMSVGEFENEFLRPEKSNPYQPKLQLRQFSVTGKMVPNPNPEGHADMVTEEYAEQWKAEHGQGTQEPGVSDEPDDATIDAQVTAITALDGAKTADFMRGLSKALGIEDSQAAQVMMQLEQLGVIQTKLKKGDTIDPKTGKPAMFEHVFVDKSQLKSPTKVPEKPAVAKPEPEPEPELKKEAPFVESGPELEPEPDQKKELAPELKIEAPQKKEEPKPKPKPKSKAPGQAQPQPSSSPLPSVDTSKAVSPITQQDLKDQGKAKELEQQFWRLLGGPGFNPYKTSVRDMHLLVCQASLQYDQPDHGPLGTDGEVDHPAEDMVVQHA